jgi:hypothetical protein
MLGTILIMVVIFVAVCAIIVTTSEMVLKRLWSRPRH